MTPHQYFALGNILYLMSETKGFVDWELGKIRSILRPCVSRNWFNIEFDKETNKPVSVAVWAFMNTDALNRYLENEGRLAFSQEVFGRDKLLFTHFISKDNGFRFLKRMLNTISSDHPHIRYCYGLRGFKDKMKTAKVYMPHYRST